MPKAPQDPPTGQEDDPPSYEFDKVSCCRHGKDKAKDQNIGHNLSCDTDRGKGRNDGHNEGRDEGRKKAATRALPNSPQKNL